MRILFKTRTIAIFAAWIVLLVGCGCGNFADLEHTNPYDPDTPKGDRARAEPPTNVRCPLSLITGDSITVTWEVSEQSASLLGHVVYWGLERERLEFRSDPVDPDSECLEVRGLQRGTSYWMAVSALAEDIEESKLAPVDGACEIVPVPPLAPKPDAVLEDQYPTRRPEYICIERNQEKAYVGDTYHNTLHVVDLGQNVILGTIDGMQAVSSIVCDPERDRLYAFEGHSLFPGEVRVLDTATDAWTGDIIQTGKLPGDGVVHDDYLYLTNSYEGSVSKIDLTTLQSAGDPTSLNEDDWPDPIAYASQKLYVVNQNSGTVAVIDADSMELLSRITLEGTNSAQDVCAHPDGSQVYVIALTGDFSGVIKVIDTDADQIVASVQTGRESISCAVCDDLLYAVNQGDGDVSIYNIPGGYVLEHTVEVGTDPAGIAVTGDCETIYVTNAASGDISIRVYDGETDCEVHYDSD